MNKEIRKVKLISRNVLETLVYYSRFNILYTLRKSLQTTSALSATSKQCFEQPAASFLVCTLIFIEYYSQATSPFSKK